MDRQIQRRETSRRLLVGAAWIGLMAAGGKRGGILGWVAIGAGALGLGTQVSTWLETRPEWRKLSNQPLALRRLLARGRGDLVDEAAKNSFPASDAAAYEEH